MAKQLNLIYALQNGSIVNVSDVESGLKCSCVCPACGERLVAKKGDKMMHHFAHYSGANCAYGYESSLHLAAKDILSRAKKMTLPPVYVNFPDSYKEDELVFEATEIDIEKVELEKRYEGIVPDVVVYSGGKSFFVEIYVTHAIDDEKLQKVRNAKISTLEIDLSKKTETVSTDALTAILLSDCDEKRWKYNRLSEMYYQRFLSVADRKEITSRGFAMHVDYCPIKTRMWRGKPYANFIDDCLYCKYCIAHNEDVFCSGRKRIATVADFSVQEEDRIKSSETEMENEKKAAFARGICPNCGSRLVERQSKYGKFLGCSGYPHCRFMASPDPTTGEIIMKY